MKSIGVDQLFETSHYINIPKTLLKLKYKKWSKLKNFHDHNTKTCLFGMLHEV